MDEAARLAVFQAQTSNVLGVEAAYKKHMRAINQALRRGPDSELRHLTTLQLLLYSAWSEAVFLKVVHTPYGLTLDEVKQVRDKRSRYGIGSAWEKLVELGIGKAQAGPASSFRPNAAQQLKKWIEDYVVAPSQLRNKAAHGQWISCLNSTNTAVNPKTTADLTRLDCVTIDRWFRVHKELAAATEDLIESPNRAFRRDFSRRTASIQQTLDQTSKWTVASRQEVLRRKPIPLPAGAGAGDHNAD